MARRELIYSNSVNVQRKIEEKNTANLQMRKLWVQQEKKIASYNKKTFMGIQFILEIYLRI